MTVWTTNLPTRLPESEPITTAATNIRTTATTARQHVTDAQSTMNGLSAVFDTPDTAAAESAMTAYVKPFVVDADLAAAPVVAGLENFASDIDLLRGRFTRVKEDVSEHNDRLRPPADDPMRQHYDDQEYTLQQEVDAVGALYDEAVEKCENKVKEGSPFTMPEYPHSNGINFGVGAAITSAQTWFQSNAEYVRVRNGRITISTQSPIRPSTYRIQGSVMRGLGIPASYVERYMDVLGTNRGVSIGAWERAVGEVRPNTPLGVLFGTFPWLKRRFLDAHPQVLGNGTVNGRLTAQDPRGIHPRAHGENRNRTIRHANSGRWSTAGRVLGGAANAFGFVTAGIDGYNNSVDRDPHAPASTHLANAAVDASIETAASVAGAQVGGMVGRGVGAAVGQALIPIPGVGAAVGGVVGGFLGNIAGGFIGGQIGKGINAARHSEGDSFGDKAQAFLGGLFG